MKYRIYEKKDACTVRGANDGLTNLCLRHIVQLLSVGEKQTGRKVRLEVILLTEDILHKSHHCKCTDIWTERRTYRGACDVMWWRSIICTAVWFGRKAKTSNDMSTGTIWRNVTEEILQIILSFGFYGKAVDFIMRMVPWCLSCRIF